VPSEYTTDFLGVLYNYISDDIEMIFFNYLILWIIKFHFQMKNIEWHCIACNLNRIELNRHTLKLNEIPKLGLKTLNRIQIQLNLIQIELKTK